MTTRSRQPMLPRPRSAVPAPPPANGAAPATPQVRPARIDLPLRGGGRPDPLEADPLLAARFAAAREKARSQAQAQGYAAGWAQGRRAAAEQAEQDRAQAQAEQQAQLAALTQRASSALAALAAAAQAVRSAAEPTWEQLGDALVDTALQLTEQLLDRELAAVDSPCAEAVRRAVRQLGEPGPVQVRVNPGDLPALRALPGLQSGQLVLSADPQVPAGGAVATGNDRELLAHLPTALAAARQVLGR